jgi:hypothetical protein
MAMSLHAGNRRAPPREPVAVEPLQHAVQLDGAGAEDELDPGQELRQPIGLRNEAAARDQRFVLRQMVRIAGGQDDLEIRAQRDGLAGEREAVEAAGQHDVAEEQVDPWTPAEHVQPRLARRGGEDVVAGVGQEGGENLSNIACILDAQDRAERACPVHARAVRSNMPEF